MGQVEDIVKSLPSPTPDEHPENDLEQPIPSFGAVSTNEVRRIMQLSIGIVVGSIVLVIVMTYGSWARAFVRGECSFNGQWRYSPSHRVEPSQTAAMDLEAIHEELFPRWVTAAGHFPAQPEREQEAFDNLTKALQQDPNLAELTTKLRETILDEHLVANADQARYLTWAWSHYLDQREHPLWLQGGVGIMPGERGFFYAVSYRTTADFMVRVGEVDARVRLVERVDHLNIRERYLGRVTRLEDGAVIIDHQAREFVTRSIWPLLGDFMGPIQEPTFAKDYFRSIRAEVAGPGGLSPEHRAIFARTAIHRALLDNAVESINTRRFCSRFGIRRVPFNGYEDHRLFRFALLALRDDERYCPRVKLEEAEALLIASWALRSEPDLEEAVNALLEWFIPTVAVHESRHVADEVAGGVEDSHGSRPETAAEVSAYLASFAWGPAPATAFYQACTAVSRGTNPHAAAMESILQRLDHDCEDGPPIDLVQRARELEEEMLGRSEPISLPEIERRNR